MGNDLEAPYYKQIIEHSVLCAYQMLDALQFSFADRKDKQRPIKDHHAWLELLLNICIEYGESIHYVAAQEFLATLKATTKAGKIAKKLLALETNGKLQKRDVALNQALQLRIAHHNLN